MHGMRHRAIRGLRGIPDLGSHPDRFNRLDLLPLTVPVFGTRSPDASLIPPLSIVTIVELSMTQPSTRLDPLNSPFPVPWNWVMAMLGESSTAISPLLRYYRSPSLVSPDGQYAAYSRIQMRVQADVTQSQVASVLFLENLETGALQVITASSPFANNPFVPRPLVTPLGTIAIIIPVAWSEQGDRILSREFESLFGTDIASDYAVVWDQRHNSVHTLAPAQVDYSNAVVLGWSKAQPSQVLFQTGHLGETERSRWTVDLDGQTIAAASDDQPVVFGTFVNNIWTGPQAYG